MKKWFRVLVALVLVCVLVVNVSPIRALASALPEVAGVVTQVIPFNPGAAGAAGAAAGSTVFGWVLLGLGIIVTTAQAIDLMNRYSEWSGELETSIYYYPDGSWSYGVDMGFVERVREFLFHTGVVVEGVRYSGNYPDGFADVLSTARTYPYAFVSYSEDGSPAQMAWTDVPFVEFPTTSGYRYLYCGAGYNFPHYICSSNKTITNDSGAYAERLVWVGTTSPPPMYSDYGELGTVAPPEVDIPTGYPEWHTNVRPATNPDTQEEITVLPIPLDPNTEIIPDGVTQPDIWQGSIADPMPDSGTDTDPDTGTDTDGSIAETPWEDFKNWFIPSGDIDSFGIQLKDFFPFCVPFDLYDFLTCLAAEPEAPVFRWEIPVPQLGKSYELVVDLSAWDDVAELFRNMELLAFIVGLAYVTREKFLRS